MILKSPCLVYVSGPTCSGKSTFVKNLISNSDRLFDKKIDRIIWCYGIETKELPNVEGVELYKGPPDLDLLEGDEHKRGSA